MTDELGGTRAQCCTPGCTRLVEAKQRDAKGKMLYRNVCYACHEGGAVRVKRVAQPKACQQCGWYGHCHRHRIIPGGSYAVVNIKVLCPNCHASAHGQGQVNQQQVYKEDAA